MLEAKLLAGHSGYDIVVPSASPFMARQIAAGAYLPLDKAKLPNLQNLDPRMLALAATADPGNRHGVPYLWSVTGLGYNAAMLDRMLGPPSEATMRRRATAWRWSSIRILPRSSTAAASRSSTRRRR